MHHIIHLAIYTIYAFWGASFQIPENVTLQKIIYEVIWFLIFSYPYWLWTLASLYKKASSKLITLNYCCLHALFLYFDLSVKSSESPEALNFWILYFFLAPWVLAIGAYIGRYFFNEKESA